METTKFDQTTKQGAQLRALRPGDGELATSLINEFSRRVSGLNELTRAELENFWTTPGVDPAEDIRMLVSKDGQPLGYVEALTMEKPPAHPSIYVRPHPDHLEDGSAEMLLDWAIERCSRAVNEVPFGLRVVIGTHNVNGCQPLAKLFETRGFVLFRHSFHMEAQLTQQPAAAKWPQGIVLKPFDVERDAAAVYRAHDEAFSDHFGHIEQPFEDGFAIFRHLMIDDAETFDASLWFVAMDGDQIAGYSLCQVRKQDEPPVGWVNDLGVRRPWRKRGLGTALLQHSFAEFYRRGLRKAGLGVDASNLTGALKIYERAGMTVARRYDRYEKELRPGKELMTRELSE